MPLLLSLGEPTNAAEPPLVWWLRSYCHPLSLAHSALTNPAPPTYSPHEGFGQINGWLPPLGRSTAQEWGRGEKPVLSVPLPSAGQLEGISASGQAAPRLVSECYCPAKGFLLNGVSPAAALQLRPCSCCPGEGEQEGSSSHTFRLRLPLPDLLCGPCGITEVTRRRRAHSLQPHAYECSTVSCHNPESCVQNKYEVWGVIFPFVFQGLVFKEGGLWA